LLRRWPSAATSPGRDFPGSGRFAGSVITGYQGEWRGCRRRRSATQATDARTLEGRITLIAYSQQSRRSILEAEAPWPPLQPRPRAVAAKRTH
jgi:hypothetical protein